MANNIPTKLGQKIYLSAIIEEHLILGKKEWFTLRFPNNSTITIDCNFCKENKEDC